MKIVFYLLFISFLFSSCATLFNRTHKYIDVYTSEPSHIIYETDTIKTVDNKITLRVKRDKNPLSFVAYSDSFYRNMEIKSRNSLMFWANIGFTYGLGMIGDMNNPKRYTYPKTIYIKSYNSKKKYYKYVPRSAGQLYFQFSLPHVNSFNFKPENELKKINTGFFGLKIGLDYHHRESQF